MVTDWDLKTDVVAVGSGGGAMCAALVARSRGLDALVLEKTALIGGSTAMSGGGIWIPNNPLMREDGVADSEANALKYFDAVVGDVGPASSQERRRAYVDNAPRMMSFLQDRGVRFLRSEGWSDYYSDAPGGSERGRTVEAVPYDTHRLGPWEKKLRPGMTAALGVVSTTVELVPLSYYNRSLRGLLVGARVLARTVTAKLRAQALVASGSCLMGKVLELAIEDGVEIWTEAPLQDLVVEDGRVVGVIARKSGKDQRVAARCGVLLAAGGFSRNREMRARFGGAQATTADWSGANPGDTGEVLEIAMAHGAATDMLDEAIWNPAAFMPDGTRPSYGGRQTGGLSRARYRPGSIMVDASGRRFANETGSYMELGQRMFARNRESRALPSWLIFDDAFRRRYIFGRIPGRLPKQWFDDGFVRRADTLEALARGCGIDPAGLDVTVQRFNDYARTGVDADFHRGERAYDRFQGDPRVRPNNCLAPVERPPFYAIAMYPGDVGTFGGVLADENGRVLRADGEPIPGLYATGNITASVMGRRYLGAGASIGASCTFGFVAANDMADRAAIGADLSRR
jgi:3-oxosteroid 1-dehydrogenase